MTTVSRDPDHDKSVAASQLEATVPQSVTSQPLTDTQRAALSARTKPREAMKQAASIAIAVPIVLPVLVLGIAKILGRIPLFGWLLALYGLMFAILAGVLGVVAFPIVLLLALPAVLLTSRSKLLSDLTNGVAETRSGTFAVTDRTARGFLACGESKLILSSKEMAALRPMLKPGKQGPTFAGSVSYAPRSRTVLLVSDESGTRLISAG